MDGMKVLRTIGNSDSPYYTNTLANLGTARWTDAIQVTCAGDDIPAFVRVHGRTTSPTGGGSVTIGCGLIADGAKPADGTALGNAMAGSVTATGGLSATSITVATTAATSFSAIYAFGSGGGGAGFPTPCPAKYISLRVGNPGTAFSAGNVYIDSVELLG